MSPRELTKSQQRRLREISGIAHERELARELASLEAEFKRWRSGQLEAQQLCERIHEFHQGPARKLYIKYDTSSLEFVVAQAIHSGLISKSEAGDEVLELVSKHLAIIIASGAENENESESDSRVAKDQEE